MSVCVYVCPEPHFEGKGKGAKSFSENCALIESFGVDYVYFVQVFIFDLCKTVPIVLRINK